MSGSVAYEFGRQAYWNGHTLADCPYDTYADVEEWWRGYRDTKRANAGN